MSSMIKRRNQLVSILMVIAMIFPLIPVYPVSANEGSTVVEQAIDDQPAMDEPESPEVSEESELSNITTESGESGQPEETTESGEAEQPEATTGAEEEAPPEVTTEVEEPEEASTAANVNSISGFVWKDIVEDGEYKPENDQFPEMKEEPVVGHTIELLQADDRSVVDEVETDEDGNYRFEDIAPGEYTVQPKEGGGLLPPTIGLLGRNRIMNEQDDAEFAGTVGKLIINETSQITDMDMGMKKLQIQPRALGDIDISTVTTLTAPVGTTFVNEVLTFTSVANGNTYKLTGTVSGINTRRIVVDPNVNVTIILDGVSITEINGNSTVASLFEMGTGSDVTLYLALGSTNLFQFNGKYSTGSIATKGLLTIEGEGTLNAIGSGTGAGIHTTDGTLHIKEGVLTCKAMFGAAIGGRADIGQSGGTVIIDGGIITADSSAAGAGIGGGNGAFRSPGGAGGVVTINGGIVTATAYRGAGIGGGCGGGYQTAGMYDTGGAGGIVTINGGIVIAKSSWAGAGIGGGTGNQPNKPSDSGINVFTSGSIEARGTKGRSSTGIPIESDGISVTKMATTTNGSANGAKNVYCVEVTVKDVNGAIVPNAAVIISDLENSGYNYTAKANVQGIAYCWVPANATNKTTFEANDVALGYGEEDLTVAANNNNAVTVVLGMQTTLFTATGTMIFKQSATPKPETLKVEAKNAVINTNKRILKLEWFRVSAEDSTVYTEADFATGYGAAASADKGIGGTTEAMQEQPGGDHSLRKYEMPIGANGKYWVKMHYQDGKGIDRYQVKSIVVDHIYTQATGTYKGVETGIPTNVLYDDPIPDTVIKNKVGIAYDLDGTTALFSTVNGTTKISADVGISGSFSLPAKNIGTVWVANPTSKTITITGLDLGENVFNYTMTGVAVEFDPQGGTPTPSTAYYMSGALYGTLPTNVSKSGHNLAGWSKTPNGPIVLSTDTVAASKLYAQWTPKTYNMTVNYVDRSGTPILTPAGIETGTFGVSFAPTIQPITGFVFVDWYPGAVTSNPVLKGNKTPTLGVVSGAGEITLVYGQDSNGNGTEDFKITEEHYEGGIKRATTFKNIDLDLPYNGVANPSIISGNCVYTGYEIDGGGVVLAPSLPQIPKVAGVHTVKYYYTATYSLTYHINGGNSATPTALPSILSGTNHTLDTTVQTHVQHNGKDVVFIGWVDTQPGGIYDAAVTTTAPIPLASVSMTGDKNVYAAWGYDTTGTGIADVMDSKFRLTYHINGGSSTAPTAVPSILNGTNYTLDTTIQTHAQHNGKVVVFIGWVENQPQGIYDAAVTTTVPVPLPSVQITSNTDVYAAWGYDTTGTGIADVMDSKFSLTYHINGGSSTAPAPVPSILNGTNYTFDTTVQTHAQHNGKNVVFIGWVGNPPSGIYDITTTTTVPVPLPSMQITSNTDVYAAWGYDTTGTGVADVMDAKYNLTYYINGGSSTAPAPVLSVLNGTNYTLDTTVQTHAQHNGKAVVFIGWVENQPQSIYDAAVTTTAPIPLPSVKMSGNKDVYAAWGYDTTGNGIADVVDSRYSLTYHINGGSSTAPTAVPSILNGTNYILDTTVQTHAQHNGKAVVFIGWVENQPQGIYDATVITIAPIPLPSVSMTGNKNVYAAWGYDTTGNGIADVMDSRFSLTYHINGGSSPAPAPVLSILNGTNYTLDATVQTHAQHNGKAVVFIGWVENQPQSIYDTAVTTTVPVPLPSVQITSNTDVYAAWGYDTTGTGIADVMDAKYSLTYHINGGSSTAPAPVPSLLNGTNYTLDTTVQTHAQHNGKAVVFIGWVENQPQSIYDAAVTTTAPIPLPSVSMTGNKNVYAAWGYDTTGTGIADVMDSKFSLTYHINGGSSTAPAPVPSILNGTNYTLDTTVQTHAQHNGKNVVFIGWVGNPPSGIYDITTTTTVPVPLPSVQMTSNTDVYAAWGYDTTGTGVADVMDAKYNLTYYINGGSSTAPAPVLSVLNGTNYTLDTTVQIHAQHNGKAVVFIGWVENQPQSIYDAAVTTTAPIPLPSVKMSENKDVYAAWGYDTTGSGIADVMDSRYKLIYGINGGSSTAPAQVSNILNGTAYPVDTTVQTHAQDNGVDVVFIGWITTQVNTIYSKHDTAPVPLVNVNITSDTTVYAAWGYDTTGSGSADVTENKYSVIYNVNGGNNNGPQPDHVALIQPSYLLDSNGPTHSPVSGVDVVFIGWTAAQDNTIYSKNTTPGPAKIPTITITGTPATTTVYAVWGYDTTGSGIADIEETKHTLTIYVNDGTTASTTQSLMANELGIAPGTPTRTGYVFGGWYQDNRTFLSPWNFVTDTITANKDIYAKWTKESYTINVRYVDRNDAPVAPAGTETATYNDAFTATGILVSGKVYAGWYIGTGTPALSTVSATTLVPHIATPTNADDNSTITLVYDQYTGGGSGGGGSSIVPPVKTYTVTETHMSGTNVIKTYSRTVSEGNTYNGAVDSSLPKGYTYTGYNVDNNAVKGTAPSLPTLTNVRADHTVILEYTADQCEINVTYEYHANDGKVTTLSGSQKVTVAGGTAFTPTIPKFKQKTQTEWTLNGKAQTGKPQIKSVVNATTIVLIYQQDMDEDGVHDYSIKEVSESNSSGKVLQTRTVYIAKGKSYTVVPKQINHHTYAGYRVDGGKLQKVSNNMFTIQAATPAIQKVTADHTVEMLYVPNVYQVTVKVIDENGKSIRGKGYTVNREYQQQFIASAPHVKDHEFVEWILDGKKQNGSTVEIASVEKNEVATAVFQKIEEEEQKKKTTKEKERKEEAKKENYEFIKKPNVDNVAAGQTVTYTFSGFGNKWNVPLEKYAISDKPDKGLDFVSANLPAFTKGAGVTYDIIYYTNKSDEQRLGSNVRADQPFSCKEPTLQAGEYITAISLEFGTVPAGFALGDTMKMTFKVWDTPPAGTLTNIGILTYKVNGKNKEVASGYGSGSVTIDGYFTPPKTGDSSSLALTYATMGVSLGGIILLTGFKKRKKRKSA